MELIRRMSRRRLLARSSAVAGAALVTAACASSDTVNGALGTDTESSTDSGAPSDSPTAGQPAVIDPATIPRGEVIDFGEPPEIPEGPLSNELAAAVAVLYGERLTGTLNDVQLDALDMIGNSGDVRLGWLLSDHIRVAINLAQFEGSSQEEFFALNERLEGAAANLVGMQFPEFRSWNPLTNTLIACDVPEPPDYLAGKRNIYTAIEPAWEALMTDNSSLDWRVVSWGGVLIDDRPYDTTDDPCNCIPAIDNPTLLSAEEGTWLPDGDIVFGVVVNGEARAYPRQIMEVREMVNDTLGGRDFGMPYCTLCGAAQVWFTDEMPDGMERPILRTSGMLSRSNKVMYDLNTGSIFDTFRGTADSGPLHEEGIALTGHTVVTSTWGAWKEEHPDTTILTEDLSLGRNPDFRNNRDADGPIFPIGNVDPRLAIQEDVLGVLLENGRPLAIHVNSAASALSRGEIVEVEGVQVVSSGDGVVALDADGNEIVAHQAFWFAWSQFYPTTQLWPDV